MCWKPAWHFETAWYPLGVIYMRRRWADHTLVDNDNIVEEPRNCTQGRGPDILIEATGRIQGYEKTFQLIRPGGRIMAFGMPGAGRKAQFEPFQVVLAELSMTGSVAGMGEDVYDAIRLVSHGRFKLEPYTSLKIPLENIAEGFKKAEDKSAIKVLIDMAWNSAAAKQIYQQKSLTKTNPYFRIPIFESKHEIHLSFIGQSHTVWGDGMSDVLNK